MNIWDDILGIVDIETTNFLQKGGKIVEVGIAGLHLPTGGVITLFDSRCQEPGLTHKDRHAWIFQNSSLTQEEVREAPMFSEIQPEIERILSKTRANTAFNKKFDFSFLRSRGVNVGKECACPMLTATPICQVPKKNGQKGHKWPTVEEAWAYFFPDQAYVEEHRGLDDARHEALIVHALYKLGAMEL